MLWKQCRGADVNGADGFVARIGGGHRHDGEEQALDNHLQHAGHARRVVPVVAFGDKPGAHLFQLAVAGLVIGVAFLLVDRAALRLAPEGAPGQQLALGTDLLVEVGEQQGVELGGASANACFQFARCSAAGESKFSGVVRGLATIDTGILGPLQVSGTAKKGQDVFLAVRPEKLKLALKKPTAALNAITGVVSAISYHGDRHYFLVTAQGFDRPVSVSQQNDSELKSSPVHAGVKVWVAWPATSVLVPAQ